MMSSFANKYPFNKACSYAKLVDKASSNVEIVNANVLELSEMLKYAERKLERTRADPNHWNAYD